LKAMYFSILGSAKGPGDRKGKKAEDPIDLSIDSKCGFKL